MKDISIIILLLTLLGFNQDRFKLISRRAVKVLSYLNNKFLDYINSPTKQEKALMEDEYKRSNK